jgi:hypothetical protein
MKYCKILIYLNIWHLKPYKIEHTISENKLTEYGFLCFKLILTNEK